MKDSYWTVGPKKFYNKFLALQEERSTGLPLKFHFFEEDLDQIDWQQNPLAIYDWNQLLRDRALELRRNYDYIRLWFSGGHDSHLALETFLNNGIFIDEIAIVALLHDQSEHKDSYPWLISQKDRLDPRTKIKIYENNYDTVETYWSQENWWETQLGLLLQILPRQHGMVSSVWPELNRELDQGRTLCNISGIEKSRVLLDKNKWYAVMYDVVFMGFWGGAQQHEPFYISPKLWHYQTWHLKCYIEAHFSDKVKNNPDWINWKFQNAVDLSVYRRYCDANLRLPSLNENCGGIGGKIGKAMAPRYQLSYDQISKWNPKIWENYTNGLQYLQKNHGDYFNNNNVIDLYKGTPSKLYYMGDARVVDQ